MKQPFTLWLSEAYTGILEGVSSEISKQGSQGRSPDAAFIAIIGVLQYIIWVPRWYLL